MEDKSLLEVREWKRKTYEKYKDLSPEEHVKKLNESADQALKKWGIKLKVAKTPKNLDKKAI